MTTETKATEYAEGLRALADMVETNPDGPLMKDLRYALARMLAPVDDRESVVTAVRAALRAGAKVDKYLHGDYAGALLIFGPITIQVYTEREEVCERVVVGTKTETKKVKDPEALAAVPEVEVTEEVEIVEWRCMPLLADRSEPVGASA